MTKINTLRLDKIWGYELWLYSPLLGHQTTDEHGQKTTTGPLVKIIHAHRPLSVQVHPDDHFAQLLEKQPNGKTESWYILAADPDAKLVLGMTTYDPKTIRDHLQAGTFEQLLKTVRAQAGAFYNIPAGLVHGLGGGITVLEVQQPSDVTYRYYDYNRTDAAGKLRPLHLDQAIQVQQDLDYHLVPQITNPLTYQNHVAKQAFYKEPTTLVHTSIVVDLETYECFVGQKGDVVAKNNYVIINY